jgi:hypothetical protein
MKIMSKCQKWLYLPAYKPMTPRRIMLARAEKLSKAVLAAHKSHMPGGGSFIFSLLGNSSGFLVKDVPNSVHVPTSPEETIEVLDDVSRMTKLPEKIKAADLGSGLGSFACSLSLYLDHIKREDFHVTGFEISNILRPEAEKIAKKHGIKNVSFINKDFTKMTRQDFNEFNFIYAYKPFNLNFGLVMRDVLPRIAPGTMILTRLCGDIGILKASSLFTPVFNPLFAKSQEEYTLYIRTDKEVPQGAK